MHVISQFSARLDRIVESVSYEVCSRHSIAKALRFQFCGLSNIDQTVKASGLSAEPQEYHVNSLL